MSGVGAIARAAILRGAAYRMNYWIGLLGLAVMLSVQYFLWRAVHIGAGELAQFGLPQLLTYVLLARVIASAVAVDLDERLGQRVRLGGISLTSYAVQLTGSSPFSPRAWASRVSSCWPPPCRRTSSAGSSDWCCRRRPAGWGGS